MFSLLACCFNELLVILPPDAPEIKGFALREAPLVVICDEFWAVIARSKCTELLIRGWWLLPLSLLVGALVLLCYLLCCLVELLILVKTISTRLDFDFYVVSLAEINCESL